MSRKGVPKRVTRRSLRDPRRADGLLHRPLHRGLMHVMAAPLPRDSVPILPRRGEDPLPRRGEDPLPRRGEDPLPRRGEDPLPRQISGPGRWPCGRVPSATSHALVTRSLPPLPRRTRISPRAKSSSFRRNVRHSSRHSLAPTQHCRQPRRGRGPKHPPEITHGDTEHFTI